MSQEQAAMKKQAEQAEKESRIEKKRKKLPEDFLDSDKSAKDDLQPKKKRYSGEPLPIPPLRLKTPKKGGKSESEKKGKSTSEKESTSKTVTPKKSSAKKTLDRDNVKDTPSKDTPDKKGTANKDTPSKKDAGRFSGEYMLPLPLRDKHLPWQVCLINPQSK